jgi:hypothetical protein
MAKRNSALLLMGIGAGLMYLLDPQMGNRRRALLRNKAAALQNDAERLWGNRSEDVRNRALGLAAKVASRLAPRQADDTALAARVKSELGRHMLTNPGALEVSAENGVVTLHGHVLADEVQRVVRKARRIPGVKRVENQLMVHQQPGGEPDLQTDLGTATTPARSGRVEKKGPANR